MGLLGEAARPLRLGRKWRLVPTLKATRIEVRSACGRTYYLSRFEADQQIEKHRLEWVERGVSARATLNRQYVDYSNVVGRRVDWRVVTSGYCGPEVLELT